MTIGMIVLVASAILIYLGIAQRVLDKLQLTDRAALVFVGALVIGGFLPDVPITQNVSINIGGGIVPVVLAGYLIIRAGTVKEKVRAVAAAFLTALVVYGTMKVMPLEPTYNYFLDPMYIFAIIAGVAGYLAGRSRRSAFIAGSMGLLLTDIFSRIEIAFRGGTSRMAIGGAGVFDSIVIGGILALMLAELIGESRERIQGGPANNRPDELKAGLSDVELGEEYHSEEQKKMEGESNEK